jgi:hypothetical protein
VFGESLSDSRNKPKDKTKRKDVKMSTMKLAEAIDKFQFLNDGDMEWSAKNLIEALQEDKDNAVHLGDIVYVDEIGIRKIDEDGPKDYLYFVPDAEVEFCESCAVVGIRRPAVTHSVNPDYSGYNLCYECAAEYDSRM